MGGRGWYFIVSFPSFGMMVLPCNSSSEIFFPARPTSGATLSGAIAKPPEFTVFRAVVASLVVMEEGEE